MSTHELLRDRWQYHNGPRADINSKHTPIIVDPKVTTSDIPYSWPNEDIDQFEANTLRTVVVPDRFFSVECRIP